jgi:hypothetical protein
MFVTVWAGIIDLRTGHIDFASAGHNPPVVRHKDGSTEFIPSKSSIVMAAMENTVYKQQTYDLKPGDKVYAQKHGKSVVLAYIGTLGADVESPQDVYIKGVIASVSEFYSAQYGNASYIIRDPDGEQTFTVYRAKYLGNRNWRTGDTQIAEGDEVILKGQLTKYKTTYETSSKKAWVASLNGKTE